MRRHFEVAAAILGMLLLLTCSGGYFFLEIPLVLLLGWVWYLMRVIPEIQVNYSALAMGFIALGLFLLGTHMFARKLAEEFNRDDPASSLNGDDRPKGWTFRSTLALVTLTIVAFTAGISIVSVVHQGVWMVRSGPILQSGMTAVVSRMHSQSNLKQVGIAMHNYHYGCDGVPPGAFFSDDGRPLHGWAAILSPYLEQVEPVDIDLNVPWDDPANAEAFKQTPSTFLQPGEERTLNAQGLALNHYSSWVVSTWWTWMTL